jgi:hypothetical protein
MNWFQANRALGRFLIGVGIGTLLALFLLFSAKGSYRRARTRFDEGAAERNRLERRDPFPNEPNYGKLKVQIDNYGAALKKFQGELKNHTLLAATLAPNEFQTRLRQAMVASAEKARANRVKLPDNFALGFNEFTAVLSNTEVAPLLGQELAQVELLMNILIDARVDSVTALARKTLPPGTAATTTPASAGRQPAPSSATGPKVIERNIVDLTFVASPSAARKVLNQIASANEQLYVIRTLHVRSEKEKGPPREQTAAGRGTAADTAAATASKPGGAAALNFIVGNEHIETSARIEMLRLTF